MRFRSATFRRTVLRWASSGLASTSAGLILSACAGSAVTTSGFNVTPTTATGVTLSTERSPAGRILATPAGRTLYDFTPDTPTSSACTSGLCVRLWPPLIAKGPLTVGEGLQRSLVGTIRRSDGALQVTYGGHPLYTWLGDTEPGMITGQALLNVGGYWYVISPTGREIKANFTVQTTALRRGHHHSPFG